jgi:hypothetical protein
LLALIGRPTCPKQSNFSNIFSLDTAATAHLPQSLSLDLNEPSHVTHGSDLGDQYRMAFFPRSLNSFTIASL